MNKQLKLSIRTELYNNPNLNLIINKVVTTQIKISFKRLLKFYMQIYQNFPKRITNKITIKQNNNQNFPNYQNPQMRKMKDFDFYMQIDLVIWLVSLRTTHKLEKGVTIEMGKPKKKEPNWFEDEEPRKLILLFLHGFKDVSKHQRVFTICAQLLSSVALNSTTQKFQKARWWEEEKKNIINSFDCGCSGLWFL